MKVLVTGGTGYIGSHTVVELLNRGFEVIIIDNLSNSREEVVHRIEKITGKSPLYFNIDVCNKADLKKFFSVYKVDATIHFAAFKAVGESVEKPLLYYRNNLLSLINLLELYAEFGFDNFLFSSSCSVYGQSDAQPVSESTPLKPAESPYGNTKQIGEEILRDSILARPFRGIALRYFNPAGAHSSALIGEYPLHAPNNLGPVITQTAIGKRESFTVFGNDYNTPDGTCIRDYIHVVDIATAHVDAVNRLIHKKNKKPFELYNLGTGRGYSVMEAITAFENSTGIKLKYNFGPRRPGDVEKVWADTARANSELGWKATRSLEEIMNSAWGWEKQMTRNSNKITG
ncbi:MAG: UDP-glucose 4-epimerase GalE [Bacteroidia bacterium]|nr:UDP-glucose 4-epimerase GalE [Bacteroidia bacterium]